MAKGVKTGGGSRKGIQNKVTMQAREAIAMFVEGNVERLNGWLDDIAADNPKDAFDRFMSVVEYHIPKLARTEHQPLGKDGTPTDAVTELRVTFVDSRSSDSESV